MTDASVTAKATTENETITTAKTDATLGGIKFTVAETSRDVSGIQLTDNNGKTAYYLDGTLHSNIAPSKGYGTMVYSITATRSPDEGDLTLAQLLVNLYNNTAEVSSKRYIYLRVTAGSQARVSATLGTNDADVYDAGAEGATAVVACELSSSGATASWTGLTVYASVKANTGEENFSSAADLYANATLSATVGTADEAFEAWTA